MCSAAFFPGRTRRSDIGRQEGDDRLRTAVIETLHNDFSGGGRYSLQLAHALSRHFEVYMSNFDCNAPEMSGPGYEVRAWRNDFVPDLFIAVSHIGGIEPKGRMNAHVCFFPLEIAISNVRKFHFAISICEFADRFQKRVWGLPSIVINPYIRTADYFVSDKENLLLNVGNYFFEKDGHSKNQHQVLDWFLKSRLYKDHELVFTGFVVHRNFFDFLSRKAKPHANVKVLSSLPFRQLSDLYSRAGYLVHAMGYGRESPFQTEHFGYVAVEAMASGCQPLVHDSGGCREIEGVRTWNSFGEIEGLMTPFDTAALRELSKRYSYEQVLKRQVGNLLGIVDGVFSPTGGADATARQEGGGIEGEAGESESRMR
jgi:glycosyltransferase involved in cell wall biosynthesis